MTTRRVVLALVLLIGMIIQLGIVSSKDITPDEIIAGNDTLINDSDYVYLPPSQIIMTVLEFDSVYWFNQGDEFVKSGEYDKAVEAYNKAIELNQSYAEAWNHKVALLKQLVSYNDAIGGPNYDALAIAQRAEGNTSERLMGTYYLDIMNATPDLMPKISPGTYDSTSYVIPVGPYEVSFQMRSPLNVFGVGYTTFNRTAGSGKTYHITEYEQYNLLMEYYKGSIPADTIYVVITHYMSPSDYPPVDPNVAYDQNYIPRKWETTTPDTISIDGRTGTSQLIYKGNRDAWIANYNLNSSTFIMIKSNMNWEKDTALAIETMHITMPGQ